MNTRLNTTPATLSPGQRRLREHVTAAAADIDHGAFWEDPPTVNLLRALRARALADPLITGDARTGRDLAVPSVPATYVQVQKLRFPGVWVPSVRVAVEHLLFDGLQLGDPPIAVAGGGKWWTTYGALIKFAHERAVDISGEAAPSLLCGSSVIAVGAGSNHRTLASFLWGAATLEHSSELVIINDQRDGELWSACEYLEVACSRDLRRTGLLLPDGDGAEIRARLVALGEIAARDVRFRTALDARSQRPPPRSGLLDIKVSVKPRMAQQRRYAQVWPERRGAGAEGRSRPRKPCPTRPMNLANRLTASLVFLGRLGAQQLDQLIRPGDNRRTQGFV